jgi:hypothetical protein
MQHSEERAAFTTRRAATTRRLTPGITSRALRGSPHHPLEGLQQLKPPHTGDVPGLPTLQESSGAPGGLPPVVLTRSTVAA